jgi:hypothetical protein
MILRLFYHPTKTYVNMRASASSKSIQSDAVSLRSAASRLLFSGYQKVKFSANLPELPVLQVPAKPRHLRLPRALIDQEEAFSVLSRDTINEWLF